jgi:hypothetical protein
VEIAPTRRRDGVRRGLVVLLLAAVALGGCGRGRAERREREARGLAYADSVASAYGGRAAWEAIHYVRFDLSLREGEAVRGRFRHLWNLESGECRFESDLAALGAPAGTPVPAGKLSAVVNRRTGEGRVRVDPPPGSAGPPDEALLRLARERIEEHGRWLFLPFLLHDPSVKVEDMGLAETPLGRRPARELRMTRKPARGRGDPLVLRVFIEPGSHRILETAEPAAGAAAPRVLQWRTEVGVGGVRLVAERRETGERAFIFDLLAAPERIAPEVFTDLARRMPY